MEKHVSYFKSISFKTVVGLILIMVVLSTLLAYTGYKNFDGAMLGQYQTDTLNIAEVAVKALDADRMGDYRSELWDAEGYRETVKEFENLCNASGATFIYAIVPDNDCRHITFVFTSRNAKYISYELFDPGYYRETTNEDYITKYSQLMNGSANEAIVIRDTGEVSTDYHITGMVPIVDSMGRRVGILCVQNQMEVLYDAREKYINNTILLFLLMIVAAIVCASQYLRQTLLDPLKRITNEARRFANENNTTEGKLTDVITQQDEIGYLAGAIDSMEEQIGNYIEKATQDAADKERMKTELELAANIQMSMLPNSANAFSDNKEFDICALMDPAKEIGGDFYDFFKLDDDHLCLVIADVSGKGIPAALFMSSSKIIIGNTARSCGGSASPGEILAIANDAICASNYEEMFITVWLGILEISTGRLTYANAGHEFPVIMEYSQLGFELRKMKNQMFIGAMEGIIFTDREIVMRPGSKLFIYTDGVPEASDRNKNMFGLDNMIDELNRSKFCPPDEILSNVRHAIDVFTGDGEQFDDLTMLCLQYNGPEADK